MSTLAQYLFKELDGFACAKLLALYPENDAVKMLQAMCPDAQPWELLAQALYSGSKPVLPKVNLNHGGIYPAIEEE